MQILYFDHNISCLLGLVGRRIWYKISVENVQDFLVS
jgi:hypothetical protein